MSEIVPLASSFFIKHASEGERPVSLHLSRTTSWAVLCSLGECFRELAPPQFEAKNVGVIAVASSGIVLAASIGQSLCRKKPRRNVHLMEIDIAQRPVDYDLDTVRDIPTVVVDNSIHSGKTARSALQILSAYDVHPDVFIKPINHQDVLEERVVGSLRNDFPQTSFMSLFTLAEAQEYFRGHIGTL